jgi:ribosome-associated protein
MAHILFARSKAIPLKDLLEFTRQIVDAIAEKKGEDIVVMDLRERALFADYFVICSGASERQLNAIIEGISETARKKFHLHPRHVEGDALSGWILVDFDDVIVHIFASQRRRYYNLEELWKKAPVILRVQ